MHLKDEAPSNEELECESAGAGGGNNGDGGGRKEGFPRRVNDLRWRACGASIGSIGGHVARRSGLA